MISTHTARLHLQGSGKLLRRHAGTLLFLLFALVSCNDEDENVVNPSQIHQWRYFTKEDGLVSNFINTIFEDSKGNFWVGTNEGISVYNETGFTTYTTSDGLLDNIIFAFSEDKDGNIWAGTRRGLNILLNNQWHYFTYFQGARVFSLLQLKDEKGILVGTGGYGIYQYTYEEDGFDLFDYVNNCPSCNTINSLFEASDGSLWVATFHGARRIKGNSKTTFERVDGLAGNIATTIAEDSWGNIWIGTVEGRGISKITGQTISQVSFNNGALQNFIFGIQEDNEGGLWVGTVDNGLYHYDGAIMKQIYSGPPGHTITVLLKDSRGNLWIGTSEHGLAQYVTNPL